MDMDCIESISPTAVVVLRIGDRAFYPHLEKNGSAEAFFEGLKAERIEFILEGVSGHPIQFPIPFELDYDPSNCSASLGNIVLISKDTVALCIGPMSGEFIRIARIDRPEEKGLLDALDGIDIPVSISLEWSE